MRQRTEGKLPRHVAFVEAMPCVAVEPVQHDIGHDRAYLERLAGKSQLQGMADEGLAAVATDEVTAADRQLVPGADDAGQDQLAIVVESVELQTIFHATAQFREPRTQQRFRAELRHQQRRAIRLRIGARLADEALDVVVAAVVAIFALWGIIASHRRKPVDNTQIFEHLLAAS